MKENLVFGLFFLLLFPVLVQAQEITLYDASGEATAYIDIEDEDLPIYLWSGEPMAYLKAIDDGGYDVYGFNGKHLGWYEEGRLYDAKGFIVGFKADATDIYTQFEPIKPFKKMKPFIDFPRMAPFKAYYQNQFSSQNLMFFLLKGEKN